jgi:chaperonin GroES
MKIQPLGSRVLLQVIESEEKKSPGGIVLPDSAKNETALQGMVLAVGSDEKIEVKKSDVVLVPRYGGTELEQDQEKLLIVKSSDILAIITRK